MESCQALLSVLSLWWFIFLLKINLPGIGAWRQATGSMVRYKVNVSEETFDDNAAMMATNAMRATKMMDLGAHFLPVVLSPPFEFDSNLELRLLVGVIATIISSHSPSNHERYFGFRARALERRRRIRYSRNAFSPTGPQNYLYNGKINENPSNNV